MSKHSNSIGSRRKRRIYAALRERYGDNCHWCGKPMCFETRENSHSVSIEHLVPRSQGGANEQSNLRLAHRRCNEDRSEPNPKRCSSPFYVMAEIP